MTSRCGDMRDTGSRKRRFRSFLLSRIPPADHQCGHQLRVYRQLSAAELLLVSWSRQIVRMNSCSRSWSLGLPSLSPFVSSLSPSTLRHDCEPSTQARVYSGTFSRGSLFSGCTIALLYHDFRDGAQTEHLEYESPVQVKLIAA